MASCYNNIITWHLRFCKTDTSTLMLNVKNRVKNIVTLQTAFLFLSLINTVVTLCVFSHATNYWQKQFSIACRSLRKRPEKKLPFVRFLVFQYFHILSYMSTEYLLALFSQSRFQFAVSFHYKKCLKFSLAILASESPKPTRQNCISTSLWLATVSLEP